MARRPKGTNSIFRRADRPGYVGQVELLRQQGKRRRRYVYGRTKADVQRKIDAIRQQVAGGQYVDPSSTTVRRYLSGYLDQSDMRQSSLRRAESVAKNHIYPLIGDLPLQRFGKNEARNFFADLDTSDRNRRYVYDVLNPALDQAVTDDLLAINPLDAVKRPQYQKARRVKPWSVDEAGKFLTAADGDRYRALWWIFLTRGPRLSEALGLRFQDVDLKTGRVEINGQLSEDMTRSDYPKTGAGFRSFTLDKPVLKILKEHARALMSDGNHGGWLFPNTNGGPMAANNLRRRHMEPLIESSGVRRLTIHELRHTAATLMLLQDIPLLQVSRILGHASIKTTADIYAHILDEMNDTAVQKMRGLFDRL